jgi:uncharacterized protein (TIGR03067 family)
MRSTLLALVLVATTTFAATTGPEQELKKLQGTWNVVSLEVDGKPEPKSKAPKQLVIAGDKLTGFGPVMKLTLDPGKTPKWVDLTYTKGDKAFPVYAIYEFRENDLKLSIPIARAGKPFLNERPQNFAAEGKDVALLTLRRATKEK